MVLPIFLWPEAGPAEVYIHYSELFDLLMNARSRVEFIPDEVMVL